GGGGSRDASGRARDVTLQSLPALLGRCDGDARRLLLSLSERCVRMGDAPRARGAALARATVRGSDGHEARAQRLRIALMVPALLGIFLVGQAILDRRAIR